MAEALDVITSGLKYTNFKILIILLLKYKHEKKYQSYFEDFIFTLESL